MDTYGDAPDAQSTLNLFWEVRVLSGAMKAADDVAELRWFELDALPPRGELAFTTLADALAAWCDKRPERPKGRQRRPFRQGEGWRSL